MNKNEGRNTVGIFNNNYFFYYSDKQHEEVKEWVLAVSMDQRVEQTLPIDSRFIIS